MIGPRSNVVGMLSVNILARANVVFSTETVGLERHCRFQFYGLPRVTSGLTLLVWLQATRGIGVR